MGLVHEVPVYEGVVLEGVRFLWIWLMRIQFMMGPVYKDDWSGGCHPIENLQDPCSAFLVVGFGYKYINNPGVFVNKGFC